MEIGKVIGENLKRLRTGRGLSLGALAEECGVSKAMLSQIERGEANPTVNTVWRIAEGLNVPYSALMERQATGATVVRREDTLEQVDEDGGYRLRCYFQSGPQRDFELFTGEVSPGCTHVTEGHPAGSREYLYVQEGTLTMTVGGEEHHLEAGDWIGFDSEQRHEYRNDGDTVARLVYVNHYPA